MTAKNTSKVTPPSPSQATDTNEVLAQRGGSHGKFGDNATFHEYMLTGMMAHRDGSSWALLSARQAGPC